MSKEEFDFLKLESKMSQMRLREYNHLLTVYNDKKYKGWYSYELNYGQGDTIFTANFVRFRLPPSIPIYKGLVRNFSEEERLIGIHRMLIGKDLKEDAEKMQAYDTVNDYLKNLTEDEVKEFLDRLKDIITFDCNKIPYLLIIEKSILKINQESKIKEFVEKQIDYIDIFVKVLNNEISIQEANDLSSGIIYNEFLK